MHVILPTSRSSPKWVPLSAIVTGQQSWQTVTAYLFDKAIP